MNQSKQKVRVFRHCVKSEKNIYDRVRIRKFISKIKMLPRSIGKYDKEKGKIETPKYINDIVIDDPVIQIRNPEFYEVIKHFLQKIKSLNSFKLHAFVQCPVGDSALINLMKLFRKVVRISEFDLYFKFGDVSEKGSQALEKVIRRVQGIQSFKFKVELQNLKIAGILKLQSIISRKTTIKKFMISKSIAPQEHNNSLDVLEIKVPKIPPKIQLLDLNYNNLNWSALDNRVWKLSLGSFNSTFQSLQSLSLNLRSCISLKDNEICAFIKKLYDGESFLKSVDSSQIRLFKS